MMMLIPTKVEINNESHRTQRTHLWNVRLIIDFYFGRDEHHHRDVMNKKIITSNSRYSYG